MIPFAELLKGGKGLSIGLIRANLKRPHARICAKIAQRHGGTNRTDTHRLTALDRGGTLESTNMLLLLLYNALFSSQVVGLPLSDGGPHLTGDWGEPVRLRHLYAARHGLHLQINKDGKIGGSHLQSSHSLVEIRTVDTGCVVIKGVASARYLCMEPNGKLYGSHIYVKEDCSFLEHILPNGYNIYMSGKHGTLLSLGGGKKRPQNTVSQFLPMVNTLSQEPKDYNSKEGHSPVDPEWDLHLGLQTDIESFGKISQIVIQSPSFNKR